MENECRFFYPTRPSASGRRKNGGKPVDWGYVFHILIKANHGRDFDDIGRRLTRRQIDLYFNAEQRDRRLHRVDLMTDVNAAYVGGKHLKRLSDELKDL